MKHPVERPGPRPARRLRTVSSVSLGTAVGLGILFHCGDLPRACACGVPPPGAPPGFRCTEGDGESSAPPRFRTGANYTFSSTRISFSNDQKADVARQLVASSLEYRVSDVWTLQFATGLLLSGAMRFPTSRHAFVSGLSLAFGGSYRLVEEKGALPFVGLTATLGYANAKTQERSAPSVGYNAFDLRMGAVVGKSIADIVTVYGAARLFGGPIFWKLAGDTVTGTDVYKYQFGAGASLVLAKRVDVFIEGIALGERMISAGLGVSY